MGQHGGVEFVIIQTCSAKESGSSPRCDPMAAQPHLWPASQASLRILMSGQGFLRDFKAFGSRPSLDGFIFLYIPLIPLISVNSMIREGGGDPPPLFNNFHQKNSVRSWSEINLLINRVSKVEKRIQSWTLRQDFLQYDAIGATLLAFGNKNRKVEGGNWCV